MSALRMALETSVWWHIVLTTMLITCIAALSTVFSYVLGGAPSRRRKKHGDVMFFSFFISLTTVVIVCDVIASVFASVLCAPPYMLACACAMSILTLLCSVGVCELSMLYATSFATVTIEERYTAPKKHRPRKNHTKKHAQKHRPPQHKHSTVRPHRSKPKKKSPLVTQTRLPLTRILRRTASATKFSRNSRPPTHIDTRGEAVRRAIAHGTIATFTGIAFVILYNLA